MTVEFMLVSFSIEAVDPSIINCAMLVEHSSRYHTSDTALILQAKTGCYTY